MGKEFVFFVWCILYRAVASTMNYVQSKESKGKFQTCQILVMGWYKLNVDGLQNQQLGEGDAASLIRKKHW